MEGRESEDMYNLLIVIVIGLVEQEVRGELLVLVTGEVGLDSHVPVESKTAQPLDGLAFLLRDTDSLGARGHGSVVVAILCKKLHKTLGILLDYLRQLRVAGSHLLQNWFKHLWLLLYDLPKLLELWIVTQKIESCCTETSSSASTSSTSSITAPTRLTSLCSGLEEIDGLITATSSCGRCRGRWRRGGSTR